MEDYGVLAELLLEPGSKSFSLQCVACMHAAGTEILLTTPTLLRHTCYN